MSNFQYYTPTRVVFGKDTQKQAGELVKQFGGKKVLIHYGSGSVIKTGLLETIEKSLTEAGVPYVTLGGVVPNPRLSLVYEGIRLCQEEKVDFILAVGGGSVIDSAKAIGYGVANPGDVWDFYEGKRKATACLPIGVVLTIAASGSEMSNSCVITKEEGGLKRGYSTDLSRAKFAIMNPELTMTLPDYQTACGCVDIMMHTMERYFTGKDTMEITDEVAEALMRTVVRNAQILCKDPKNYEARAEIMWAGSLSHNGLTGCGGDGGDWMPHKLEHEMGGMFDVAHGAGLAAVWGSWARYTYKEHPERFIRFGEKVLGMTLNQDANAMEKSEMGTMAVQAIEETEKFFTSIKMPINFAELGIHPTQEQMKEMAHKCSLAVGGAKGSIKVIGEEDMYKIYCMANCEKA